MIITVYYLGTVLYWILTLQISGAICSKTTNKENLEILVNLDLS